ncbi:MAG TPA: tryptophan synthase subunit alpha, partial [Clostridiales bacterium]|nr:tryptophan synthase subunit alpha [Clostridiales bacterium]
MSRISNAFSKGKAFIPFITGGDPDLETTEQVLYALSESGADLIEIGIPFSDPIAEGPVIEAADGRALKAGCTTDKLFELVTRVRLRIETPLAFMTYYNPIFSYGVGKFTRNCAASGIDGLIVPDLPFEEQSELSGPCAENGLDLIPLIAPTSEARIARIAKEAKGFLYCVSSLGVTGERSTISNSAREMIGRAKQAADIPCAVGFGVSTPEQAKAMAAFADGVIVGSAIVRLAAEHGKNCVLPISRFA